jgi:hypothetical protein
MKNRTTSPGNYSSLLGRIADILVGARTKIAREINKAQLLAYWEIGREIIEFEQKGQLRAEYGEELILRLAKDMTKRLGKGFSKSNIFLMRQFYLTYPGKFQTLSGKSSKAQKFQTRSEKSETLSRKFTIPKTVSAKFQKKLDSV